MLTEDESDFGRIQVSPEILLSIAERSTLGTEGVVRHADVPSAELRGHNRRLRKDGILLSMDEDRVIFDIYVIMDANVNLMETARRLQSAVIEGVSQMVGTIVNAVNVHVENVAYTVA